MLTPRNGGERTRIFCYSTMALIIGVIITILVLRFQGLINWIYRNAGPLSDWVSGLITAFGILITYIETQRKNTYLFHFILRTNPSTPIPKSFGQETELLCGAFNASKSEVKIKEMGLNFYSPLIRRKLSTVVLRKECVIPKHAEVLEPFVYLWTSIFGEFNRKNVRVRLYVILEDGEKVESFRAIKFNRHEFGYTPQDAKENVQASVLKKQIESRMKETGYK